MEVVRSPKWYSLVVGSTTTDPAPTAVGQGHKIPDDRHGKVVVIRLRHTTTAGNDARTCTVKLYGWCPGERDARGDDIADSSGWDDMGVEYSLASTSADGSVTAFVLESPTVYTRLFVRVTAISGTGTSISCAGAFTEEA